MTFRPDLNGGHLLRTAANLLYDHGDHRATPWPDPVTLGIIRSRLRGLADRHDNEASGGRSAGDGG
jgi:hypothetical protein